MLLRLTLSVIPAAPTMGTDMTFQTLISPADPAGVAAILSATPIYKPRAHFDRYLIRPSWSKKSFLEELNTSGIDLSAFTIKSAPSQSLGVDLEARGHEVAKLFCSGFGRQVRREGFDMDDVLQEVYKKIMVSNQGKSPYDPSKSSFGTFVYRVAQSAFFNYRSREQRYRDRYQTGVSGYRQGSSFGTWDVAEMDHPDYDEGFAHADFGIAMNRAGVTLDTEEQEIWRLAATGHKFREIRRAVPSRSPSEIRSLIANLREILPDGNESISAA